MGSKPAADKHPPTVLLKHASAEGMEKLILRSHDSPQSGKANGPAVKMACQRQIRSPTCIRIKKERGMSQKNLKPFRLCLSQPSGKTAP